MVLKESKPHSSLAFAKHKPTCSPLLCSTFPISQCQVSPHTATSRSKGASQHAARKSKTRRGSWSHLYWKHPSATAKAPCSNSWVYLWKPENVEEEPSTTSSFEKASPPFPGQETQLCLGWRWAWKSDSQRAASSHGTAQPPPVRPLQWAPPTGPLPEPLVCSAQLQSLGIPGTFSLDPFLSLEYGEAQLCYQYGKEEW